MTSRTHAASKGFSLIELLVVILIIALIIAIVVPSLGGARNLAKRSDTESMLANISASIGSFQNDNRRLPGRFTVREMASNANLNRGMSMAENVMLELGGMRISETAPTPLTGWTTNVTPDGSPNTPPAIWVKTDETSGKSYYTPPAKYYVTQVAGQQVGQPGHTDVVGNAQLPDLVDGFGNPLLIWLEDEATVGKPVQAIGSAGDTGKVAFARAMYDPAQGPAKFYWNTNAAFLRSTNLGKGGMDMTNTSNESGTLLGGSAATDDHLHTMAALLGNPSFPAYPGNNTNANQDEIFPSASRGGYQIHSAGIDGTFMGRRASKNRGASFADNGRLYYGANFKTATNTPHVDSAGKAITFDMAKEFDDVLVGGS